MKEIAQRLYGGNANFLRIRRYGIDTKAFQEMIQNQNGKCALCLTKPAKHLDHDHGSGKVRAVLCFSCNRGLGKFEDNPLVIRHAIAYLQKSSSG
ncbi:MAG: endonuclease VII domain-containing protein [Actinomycetota bacterium]